MIQNNSLSIEYLKELLEYNSDRGIFIWKQNRGSQCKGDIAGTKHHSGYINILINRKSYSAHRLAWLYMTGEWPKDQIDHINLIKSDNRWCNLREATRSQNFYNTGPRKNNTSGFKGVVRTKTSWQVQIGLLGKTKYIGKYKNIDDARQAYTMALQEHAGEFSRLES